MGDEREGEGGREEGREECGVNIRRWGLEEDKELEKKEKEKERRRRR